MSQVRLYTFGGSRTDQLKMARAQRSCNFQVWVTINRQQSDIENQFWIHKGCTTRSVNPTSS